MESVAALVSLGVHDLTYCVQMGVPRRALISHCCHLATVPLYFSRSTPIQSEDFTVVRKISLALVLMAMAGVASAREDYSDKCFHFLWFDFCPPTDRHDPHPVKAPEIDPASAMAGLTMLAGGLAVLRGRRRINSKD
jgi:hypothetical protein